MLSLRYALPYLPQNRESAKLFSRRPTNVMVYAARGPRPRSPRVWKTRKRIGSISKASKMIACIKGLSNVKEEVYGALDSFIAWELDDMLWRVYIRKKKARQESERSAWSNGRITGNGQEAEDAIAEGNMDR